MAAEAAAAAIAKAKALSLIADANDEDDLSAKLRSLGQVKEVLLSLEPSTCAEIFPHLEEFRLSREILVRKALIQIIKKVGFRMMDHSYALVTVLLELSKDEDPTVARNAISAGTTFYCSILEKMAMQFQRHGKVDDWCGKLWTLMLNFKKYVLSTALDLKHEDVEVQVSVLKFMETFILCFTPDASDPEKTNKEIGQTFNISWITADHPILDSKILMSEADKTFHTLLNFIKSANPFPVALTIAAVSCLAVVARKRPVYYYTVLSVLLEFKPNLESLEDAASIWTSIKTALQGFSTCTFPPVVEERIVFIENLLKEQNIPHQSLMAADARFTTTEDKYKQDLLLVHLLHLACSSQWVLADKFTFIISELQPLGILSEQMLDLASKTFLDFNMDFNDAFEIDMAKTKVPEFWVPSSEKPRKKTMYLTFFEKLKLLGKGGYGRVMLCKHKLDQKEYALKLICLKYKDIPIQEIESETSKVVREVLTLSRLEHCHVVRYYWAWLDESAPPDDLSETEESSGFDYDLSESEESSGYGRGGDESETGFEYGSEIGESTGFGDDKSKAGGNSESHSETAGDGSKSETKNSDKTHVVPKYLYIQMEYCPSTLHEILEAGVCDDIFRRRTIGQIVLGLAYIHGQNIVHRDLNPKNIFVDSKGDVKIGDFGLAKFTDTEGCLNDVEGSTDNFNNSTKAGTILYKAPETWIVGERIDVKVDIYSLGIVLLELYHPFSTGSERIEVINTLKRENELPSAWASQYVEEASLVKSMVSVDPAARPSAKHLVSLFGLE